MDRIKRLLIADDDKFIRDDLGKLLQPHFEIGFAHNGYDAIKAVVRHQPCAVVLDLNLPRLNGKEVINMIKKSKTDTLVFVITGDTDLETEKSVRAMGVDGFFLKPVEKVLLLRTILENLKYSEKKAMLNGRDALK